MQNLKILSVIVLAVAFAIPLHAQSIEWMDLDEAQALAAQNDKKVMIFAEAEWCSYCQKMYRKVFPERSIQDSLHKYFYPVRIDIESDQKITFNGEKLSEKQLARKFRVTSTPTIIFLDGRGGVIGVQPGYMPVEIFENLLVFVGDDLTGTVSFKKYLNQQGVEF